jgi:drug/metabolite transporter (DMT)-like permease
LEANTGIANDRRPNAMLRLKTSCEVGWRVIWTAMISVLLGLLAAFCWSAHDLLARRFAAATGPFRMSFWIMLAGALLLLLPVLWRGQIWNADAFSIGLALAMGVIYAFALGGLLTAFSLAPVSIVGPLTAGYPALVVMWGLYNGLSPTPLQWSGVVLVLLGVIIVGRNGRENGGHENGGHEDGDHDSVAAGQMPVVIVSAVIASFAFAAVVVMGQAATLGLGEYEVTFLSRFPAAALLLLAMGRERGQDLVMSRSALISVFAMAACDVVAVTAINSAAHFPNRELGAMAISSYGAIAVVMAMLILKERVAALQWIGILLVVAGVAALGWPVEGRFQF